MKALKRKRVRELWKQAVDNYKRMRMTALQIMVHPDVTDEQILTTARQLSQVHNSLVQVYQKIDPTSYEQYYGHFEKVPY